MLGKDTKDWYNFRWKRQCYDFLSYHYNLNPKELVWAYIKNWVAYSTKLILVMSEGMRWKIFLYHSKELGNKMVNIWNTFTKCLWKSLKTHTIQENCRIIDDIINTFIINFTQNDNDETSSDEDEYSEISGL